jgi:hypothetical protein
MLISKTPGINERLLLDSAEGAVLFPEKSADIFNPRIGNRRLMLPYTQPVPGKAIKNSGASPGGKAPEFPGVCREMNVCRNQGVSVSSS